MMRPIGTPPPPALIALAHSVTASSDTRPLRAAWAVSASAAANAKSPIGEAASTRFIAASAQA
jgi:hypothetical protein